MSDDEWQAFAAHEAAEAIGQWLEAGGRLERPIRTLTMTELERMADQAVTRWIVVNSYRLTHCTEPTPDLDWLLRA